METVDEVKLKTGVEEEGKKEPEVVQNNVGKGGAAGSVDLLANLTSNFFKYDFDFVFSN